MHVPPRPFRSVIGLALVVTGVSLASGCGVSQSQEVTAVRARPTAEISRWMTSSTEPILDRAIVTPIADQDRRLSSVGLPVFALYASEAAPEQAIEAYLRTQLGDATISTDAPTSWLVPGMAKPFRLTPWRARRGSGAVGSGQALTYTDGDRTWVIEVHAEGIELGGLLAAGVDKTLTVSGYVGLAEPEPFAVQVEDPNNQDRPDTTNVARSDGQSALIEASASIDDVLVTRVVAADPGPPQLSALVSGSESVGFQPLSFIERLQLGTAGFMFDPSDNTPSQSLQDGADQGIPVEVSNLPFRRRVTPVGRGTSGNYQAQVEPGLRWTVSRLPADAGGGAELLLVEGGTESPAAIRYAIELGEYRPTWVMATDTNVYAGRKTENDATAMVLRANLDGSELVVVAQSETPDALPDGWSPATDEQVGAIESLINFVPDLVAVDAIVDGAA